MYSELPEFVKAGKFCITLPGQKYAYDPIKGYKISARDPFYAFDVMLNYLTPGSTLGLQVGSAGISAIDIDDCFMPDGSLKAFALDIIANLNAYTELSPSGTGIRILFKTTTRFDMDKFYVKNSALGIEYYDAIHCSGSGARMVRLSGNVLIAGEYIEVGTAYILNKYMQRPPKQAAKDLDSETFNQARADVLVYLVNVLPEFYEYNVRMIEHKSESDWDLAFVNMLSAYTDSLKELDYAFRRSRYFLTKDEPHKQKWNKPRYVDGTYGRIGDNNDGGILKDWLDAFDKHAPSSDTSEPDYLVEVLKVIGIIKSSSRYEEVYWYEPHVLSALIYAAEHNITAIKWRALNMNKNNV